MQSVRNLGKCQRRDESPGSTTAPEQRMVLNQEKYKAKLKQPDCQSENKPLIPARSSENVAESLADVLFRRIHFNAAV